MHFVIQHKKPPDELINADKKKEISQCLMDFCYVLNGICSTLKSDNKHKAFSSLSLAPSRIASEHKWWTEVKFMCQEYQRDSEKKEKSPIIFDSMIFNLYFIVFRFYLFPLFAGSHYNGVVFWWKNWCSVASALSRLFGALRG